MLNIYFILKNLHLNSHTVYIYTYTKYYIYTHTETHTTCIYTQGDFFKAH